MSRIESELLRSHIRANWVRSNGQLAIHPKILAEHVIWFCGFSELTRAECHASYLNQLDVSLNSIGKGIALALKSGEEEPCARLIAIAYSIWSSGDPCVVEIDTARQRVVIDFKGSRHFAKWPIVDDRRLLIQSWLDEKPIRDWIAGTCADSPPPFEIDCEAELAKLGRNLEELLR